MLPGEPRASLGDWIGAEVGLFGTGPTGSEPGHAVFGPFTFETGQSGSSELSVVEVARTVRGGPGR